MEDIDNSKILINSINVKKIFFFRKRNNELLITKIIFLSLHNYFSYLFAILYNYHFILFLIKFFIEIYFSIQIYYKLLISIQCTSNNK